jgi:hypothetical protein
MDKAARVHFFFVFPGTTMQCNFGEVNIISPGNCKPVFKFIYIYTLYILRMNATVRHMLSLIFQNVSPSFSWRSSGLQIHEGARRPREAGENGKLLNSPNAPFHIISQILDTASTSQSEGIELYGIDWSLYLHSCSYTPIEYSSLISTKAY